MTFPLTVLPEAEADLADAHRWSEQRRPGLGREFLQRVDEVFQRISESPELNALAHKSVRHALVRQFPYT